MLKERSFHNTNRNFKKCLNDIVKINFSADLITPQSYSSRKVKFVYMNEIFTLLFLSDILMCKDYIVEGLPTDINNPAYYQKRKKITYNKNKYDVIVRDKYTQHVLLTITYDANGMSKKWKKNFDVLIKDADDNILAALMYKCPMVSIGKNQISQSEQQFGEVVKIINIKPKTPIVYFNISPTETVAVDKKNKNHKIEKVTPMSIKDTYLSSDNILYESCIEHLKYIHVIDMYWKPKREKYVDIITNYFDDKPLSILDNIDVVDEVILDDNFKKNFYKISEYIKKIIDKKIKKQILEC